MKISVIVPIYFYNDYVKEMFISLKNQTYKHFELIVVGNSLSESEFQKIKHQIQDLNNGEIEIKFVFTTVKGANYSRQLGVKYSTAEYIFFLDCDDQLCDVTVLKEVEGIINKYNIDIITLNIHQVHYENNKLQLDNIVYSFKNEDKPLSIETDKKAILKNYGTNICSKFIKKSLLKDIHFLDLPYCQDWNVSSKLFFKAETFYFMSKPGYYWVHRVNSISQISSMSLEKHLKSFDSILDIIDFYRTRDKLNNYQFFLNDRVIKFCFQYIWRSSFFDLNEGLKRSLKLIQKEIKFDQSFFFNSKIVFMFLMIRFSFLYRLFINYKTYIKSPWWLMKSNQ